MSLDHGAGMLSFRDAPPGSPAAAVPVSTSLPPGAAPRDAAAVLGDPATPRRRHPVGPAEARLPARRLRVAMVVASPFPANHGTPGSIREMAEAIAAAGHEMHVVAYHSGEGQAPRGVRVHRVPDLGFRKTIVVGPTWEKPALDLLLVGVLLRVIRRERIDLIHAHNYEGAMVGFLARLLSRRPLIYSAVNTMADELPSYGFLRPRRLAVAVARLLDAVVPRLPDHTIAISEELGEFVRGRGVSHERLAVIPLGIDTARFERAERERTRQRLGLGDRPLVMYTGILDRFQRIDYLLQAMTVVRETVPDARLLLIANTTRPAQVGAVQAAAEALGLGGSVEVIESVDFAEIPHYLAAADVTVLPRPHCPGFPVKLLNYMAAARPVVLFAGSAKGLENLRHAVVVPDHDWRGLGKGICAVLADPRLAERLGAAGRSWVAERYSLAGMVARTVDVYHRVRPAAAGS